MWYYSGGFLTVTLKAPPGKDVILFMHSDIYEIIFINTLTHCMWKSTEKSVYTMEVKFINITSKLVTYDKKTRARSNV